jgi:hypothetical protein
MRDEHPKLIWSSSNTTAMILHQHHDNRSNKGANAEPRQMEIDH